MGKQTPHLYGVGQVVNETLRIVEKIRIKKRKKVHKGYIVQSIVYPNAPAYTVTEDNLKKGQGCGYTRGLRIYEGNSLWSKVEIRKHIIDIEQSKTIAPNYRKKILFKCGSCDTTKEMTPSNIIRRGFSCPNCSRGTPYPELFFLAVNQHFNLEFEYQVTYENGRFDFINHDTKTIVEMNGLAHYEEIENSKAWEKAHRNTVESDNKKREWAKENGYTLIFIDARKSEFEFIKDNINACEYLPTIEVKDIKPIIETMKANKRHNVAEIVRLYKIEKLNTYEIAKIYNVNNGTIGRILKNNGVKVTASKVIKCTTTDELFSSQAEACRELNLSKGNINACLKGKRKSTGGYIFRYADDTETHVLYEAQNRAKQPISLKIQLDDISDVFNKSNF